MRNVKFYLAFLLLIFLTSQAKAQKISTDFDPRANLSQYKTFMWIKPVHYRTDPLMAKRVMDAIDAALTSKGLQPAATGADIGVVAHIATRQEQTLQTFYDGFGGGWRWGLGWGEAITTPETYTIGTLVVDLFDTHTKQLIWRGVATDTLSDKPQKDTEKLNRAVQKMFKVFPPRGK